MILEHEHIDVYMYTKRNVVATYQFTTRFRLQIQWTDKWMEWTEMDIELNAFVWRLREKAHKIYKSLRHSVILDTNTRSHTIWICPIYEYVHNHMRKQTVNLMNKIMQYEIVNSIITSTGEKKMKKWRQIFFFSVMLLVTQERMKWRREKQKWAYENLMC